MNCLRDSANVQRNDPDVINASDLSKAELKRYVRFYFKKGKYKWLEMYFRA